MEVVAETSGVSESKRLVRLKLWPARARLVSTRDPVSSDKQSISKVSFKMYEDGCEGYVEGYDKVDSDSPRAIVCYK